MPLFASTRPRGGGSGSVEICMFTQLLQCLRVKKFHVLLGQIVLFLVELSGTGEVEVDLYRNRK